jgi:hypothetical protein
MTKPLLGVALGGVLGLLDGLSAWFSPDARPMMMAIVVGSTVKGLVTGLLTGLIARWRQSVVIGVVAGVAIGFGLSSLAAVGQGSHYFEIVLPGMLVGGLVGFVTQRYPPATPRLGTMVAILLTTALWPGVVASAAQTSAQGDSLALLTGLVGRWTGTTEGQPGKGTVAREYERILGSRFIQVRNRSTYPAQEKNPKGEVHEDTGIFSFDSARKRVVFRQFHSEGFVNQYVLDPASTPERLVLITEAIENIPTGWRARETYLLTGPNQLEETFELAEPGNEFEVYTRNRLTRER